MHTHHIIPKHMGGTDDVSNLIELTVEEHAEAHKILFEKYGHWQDEVAYKGLLGVINKEEIINQVVSKTHKGKIVSSETKKKMSESAKKRPPKSEETKKKIRQTMKNRVEAGIQKGIFVKGMPSAFKAHTEESKAKLSKRHKGKKLSKEHKEKISNSLRGNTRRVGKLHSQETKDKISKSLLSN